MIQRASLFHATYGKPEGGQRERKPDAGEGGQHQQRVAHLAQAGPRQERRPQAVQRVRMMYRQSGDPEWRTATTENVSRSGVLFRADGPLDPKTPVELMLTLPGTVAGEPSSRLRCDGHVVRTTACGGGGPRSCLAAAVADYRLASV